jgi:helix-turn-helix protein
MHRSKIGAMQRLQAFKYELRPNGEQKRNMGRFAGSRSKRARMFEPSQA